MNLSVCVHFYIDAHTYTYTHRHTNIHILIHKSVHPDTNKCLLSLGDILGQ